MGDGQLSREHGGQAVPRLIGIENIPTPDWAADSKFVEARFWQVVRTMPAAVATVVSMSWRTSRRLALLGLLVQVASGCATAFGLLATADVLGALLRQGPTPDRVLDSLPGLIGVVIAYSSKALLETAVSAVQGELRPRVTQAADDRLKAAMVRVDLLAFEDVDFRELAKQGGGQGIRGIETSLRQCADLSSSSISMLSAIIAAGLLNPWLAPVLLLAAVPNGWASVQVAKLRYRHFLANVTRNLRKSVLEEVVVERRMALERHAFTLQERLLEEYRLNASSLTSAEVQLERRSNGLIFAGRVAAALGTAACYGVLGLLLYSEAMELALSGTAVLAMRTVAGALANTSRAVNSLYEQSFYIGFYQQLLVEAGERRRPASPHRVVSAPEEIRLDDVSFTYPGQQNPALSGITTTIHRGEIIALVGENGSGKTTLGKIITGLYPPSSGSVWWDDLNLATADQESVHDRIAVIAQQPAEWPMTARHNILVGRLERADPDRTAWYRAVANSGADGVLADLPLGENTVLSRMFSDGQDLSGGQWQRIGIARGIYRNSDVLLADEPTASLDAKAESTVFAGLRQASIAGGSGRRTTILVTHRLANIQHADRILVLQQGRIVESGTHQELMHAQGPYNELYEIQASPYRDKRARAEFSIG